MQTPNKHLGGSNCRKCAHTITTEEFIIKVNKVHNNKYSYLDTVYNGAKEQVEVTCNAHGNFTQKAQSHLRGVGCPKCANESRSKKLMLTNEEFIEKAKEMLTDPSKRIGEIAEAIGFLDMAHFSKVFKDIEGMTPKQYYQKVK